MKLNVLLLLRRIQEDLDPSKFTISEIIEEGLHGSGNDDAVRHRIKLLITEGLVEKHEDTRGAYQLTEAGREY